MCLSSARNLNLLCFGRYLRLVTIEIGRSEIRHESEEEAILLRRLTTSLVRHQGKKHVVQLLDRFDIKDPIGRHVCLAVEALGPAFDLDVLSPNATWEVAKHMLEYVTFARDMGVPHGST